MLRRQLSIGLILLVGGCLPSFPKIVDVDKSDIDEYEIVGINPPKHFYLDLKNLRTGQLYERVYVSKHYNSWRKIKIGDRIVVTYTTYNYDDGSVKGKFDNYEIQEQLDKIPESKEVANER